MIHPRRSVPTIAVFALFLMGCTTAGADRAWSSGCGIEAAVAEQQISAALEEKAANTELVNLLAGCLADPDPVIRDDTAYLGLTRLMRAEAVEQEDLNWLLQTLSENLTSAADDQDGFLKPFSALVLSEVARTDRVSPWMDEDQRRALVETGASYVEGVSDYRGYIDGEGWRHGVAHGADLLMQLSLNEAVDGADARRMLEAIGAQIGSSTAPAFVFDEPRRLSRPVLFLTQRGVFSEDELTAWFTGLADASPLASWDDAFKSERALARRHNLRAFGYAVLVAATENDDENLKKLRPGALKLLGEIP